MSTDAIRQDLKLAAGSLAAIEDPATKLALGEVFALFEGVVDAIDEVGDELDDAVIGIEPERAAIIIGALQKAGLVVTALRALATGVLAAHVPEAERQQVEALCADVAASLQTAGAAVTEVTLEDVEEGV
jgi:hypothetical protein